MGQFSKWAWHLALTGRGACICFAEFQHLHKIYIESQIYSLLNKLNTILFNAWYHQLLEVSFGRKQTNKQQHKMRKTFMEQEVKEFKKGVRWLNNTMKIFTSEDQSKNKDVAWGGEQLLSRVRETENLGLWKVLEYLVTAYYFMF